MGPHLLLVIAVAASAAPLAAQSPIGPRPSPVWTAARSTHAVRAIGDTAKMATRAEQIATGALVGGIGGAVLGYGAACTGDSQCSSTGGFTAVILLGAIGAGIGAGLTALLTAI